MTQCTHDPKAPDPPKRVWAICTIFYVRSVLYVYVYVAPSVEQCGSECADSIHRDLPGTKQHHAPVNAEIADC